MKPERFAQLMSVWATTSTALVVMLLVSACGEDRTSSLPNAADPNSAPGGAIPTVNRTTSGLPDFSLSGAEINLYDSTTFKGAEEILKPTHYLVPPVVYSLVMFDIQANTSSTTKEKIYLQIEDSQQGWAAAIPVVQGATVRTSTKLDMTFSDNYLTVRAIGPLVGTKWGTSTNPAVIYYRNRLGHWSGTTWVPDENQCFTRGSLDVATPCRDAYMDTTSSSVKRLGSFSATYTHWVK